MESKRQVAQEYPSGETLHGLAKRHDATCKLILVWVRKYEDSAFDDDAHAADLIPQYDARIGALERLVGKQPLELEFLKGTLKSAPRPRGGVVNHKRSSARCANTACSPKAKDALSPPLHLCRHHSGAWSRLIVGYAIVRSIDGRGVENCH